MITITTDPAMLFVAVVLTACFASVAIFAGLAYTDSAGGQQLIRRYLAARLAGTRMQRMLDRRNLTAQRYLARTPIADIRRHLRICRTCRRQRTCDEALAYVGPRTRGLLFCPNTRAIDALVR